MKKSRLFILLASFIVGLLALCWSRAQAPRRPLRVLDDRGVEHPTLMSDQYNALVGHLEATGQTNALEMFRQYRCAYRADSGSSELRQTVAALQALRGGNQEQAIQLLEQHLSLHVSLMCNSYGCLRPTNRERVELESLERARDYYAQFPPPQWGGELVKNVDIILKTRREAATEKAVNEILQRKTAR